MSLSALDYAVIGAYLLAITAFGSWFARFQHTTRDYFLTDRSVPWWAICFTIVATGAWNRVDPFTGVGFTGSALTVQAFSTGLPGTSGGAIVSLGLALFAYSTVLGWSYYGERC